MAHAFLSPSSAYRWLACPASALYNLREGEGSEAAEEGTFIHAMAAEIMVQGTLDYTLPVDMLAHRYYNARNEETAHEYAVFCESLGGFGEAEVKLSISELCEGTADYTRYDRHSKKLVIVDLKTGRSPVDAVDNKQLGLYAIGAAEMYALDLSVTEVELVIYQPNAGGVKRWTAPEQWLIDLHADVLAAEAKTTAFRPEHVPGEHCRFCAAAHECEPYWERYADDLEYLKVLEREGQVSDEQYAPAIAALDRSVIFDKVVRTGAMAKLTAGQHLPGLQIAHSAGKRVVTDELQLAAAMEKAGVERELLFDSKFIGLTQAEKLMGKKAFAEVSAPYVVKQPGAAKLALGEAADVFKQLDTDLK